MSGYRICRKSVWTGRVETSPVLPESLARFRLEQERQIYADAKYWLEPVNEPNSGDR